MSSLTYVITGASRGLGLEFVKQLSSKGHTVFALARQPEASEALQSLVDNKNVFAVKVDTTNAESIKEAANQVSNNAPNGIDVLINNAGISGSLPYETDVFHTPASELVKIFETNVAGVSDVTQAFLPLLRKSPVEIKKVLNMSSILASNDVINVINPNSYGAAYAISKAGLNMLTKLQSNLLIKDNIVVYAQHPGWVQTDMGGSSAPTTPRSSISGMLNVLDGLTKEQSGYFYDFEGKKLNW